MRHAGPDPNTDDNRTPTIHNTQELWTSTMYVDRHRNNNAGNLRWLMAYCKPDLPRAAGGIMLYAASAAMAPITPLISARIVDDVIGQHHIHMLVGALIMMTSIDWRLALALACVTPFLFILTRKLSEHAKPILLAIRDSLASMNSMVGENIEGNRVVKAFVREDDETRKFDGHNDAYMERNMDMARNTHRYMPWLDGLGCSLQLIAFARVLLADPRILILDEATSNIDTKTEEALQAGLDHLLVGRASFIIAHRLSTIEHADVICFIDHGLIVEQGTHRELMARKGHYWRLVESQYAMITVE